MTLMLRKFWLLTVVILGGMLISPQAKASHVSGGSIKYKALGGGQYYIEVAVFRDCSGIQYSAATAVVTAQCMPTGTPTTHTLSHLAFVAPTPQFGGPYSAISFSSGANTFAVEEVSDVCDKVLNPSTTPNTRCRGTGSTILGYTRFKYSGIITLTGCNYWRLNFTPQCCRNTGNSNITTGSMSVETWFDNLNFPNNSAPDFADEVKPIPSACVGKEVKYGIGTVDQDGDSLRFEVACAKGTVNSCVTYASGFSSTMPADSFQMDSATGLIRFVSQTAGKRVVAFWVKEYERCTGKWKAQTLRDVQFRVETCTNNIPKDISGVSNLQGKNVVKLGDYKLQVCNGITMSFEDTIFDPDVNDTLVFQSNHAAVMPGSNMTIIPITKNKAVVRFTWTASIGNNPVKIFYLVFNDDRCNYPGNGFSVFEVEVRNSTSAGPDFPVCAGDTAYITASGGKMYQWQSVWGDSLIWSGTGRNVWGDTTANDTNRTLRFVPSQTTFLEVWSDLSEGCIKAQACSDRDSVKIIMAKNYNVNKHADTVICFNDSTIQIWAQPDSTHSNYTYKWSPAAYMNNDSIYNPTVTPLSSRHYMVTVTSDSGCVRHDSVYVQLTPPFPPQLEAFASDTFVCQGTKSLLDVSLGHVPTGCGLSKHSCVGATTFPQIGFDTTANAKTGTNTQITYPTPYGNIHEGARMQFIYRASELQALGVTAGLINGIGFNVQSIGGTTTYSGYTIKLRCISDSTLSTWKTGTHQVFNPKTVTISSGWNYHTFDTPYDYDGASNILVEICYGNSSTTQNSAVYYTATTWNSCIATFGAGNQCAASALQFTSRVNRPNIRFEYCKGPNPAAYRYKWMPSTYLNYDTLKDPTALVQDSITYQVLVTDTFGKCSGLSNKVKINIRKIELGKDTSLCPYDTVQISVNPSVNCSGPKTYKWTANDTNAYISNDTISNPFLMAVQNTTFTLTFSDTCGCVIVDSFKINMRTLPKPNISRTPPSCGLDNGSLIITGLGGISPYKYNLDNVLTSGKDSNTTGSFSNLNNGYYEIKVTDAGKCFVLVTDTFTNTAPIIDSLKTTDLTCYKSADGTIDISASQGIGPLTFSIDSGTTWGTSSTFTGLSFGPYKVQARSSDGCVTKPIDVFLDQPDSLYSSVLYTEVSCAGAADASAYAVPQGGTTPYTFQWGNGASTDSAKNLSGGPDSLLLTDANGCTFTHKFNIVEYPALIIDSVTYTDVTCNGYDNGTLQIYARGGKQAIFYSFNQGGTYGAINSFNNLEPKGYGVRVKDVNDCVTADTVTIREPKEVEVFSNLDSTIICVSNCALLSVGATGGNGSKYDYHWTPGITDKLPNQRVCPPKRTSYWVYAQDTVGCISTRKEIIVNFYDSLRVTTPAKQAICRGEQIELPVSGSGGDGNGYNYFWYPAQGLNNPNSDAPLASPDSTTRYSVVLTDNCGSPFDTGYVDVEILQLPDIDFVADTTWACNPGKIVLNNASKTPSNNCIWKLGDGTTWERCGEVAHIYRDWGKYDVTLTIEDKFGCVDSLTKGDFIEIARTPEAKFNMDPENPTILNPDVQFTDKSKGLITDWFWNFAGFGTSTEQNPMFTFPETHKDKYPVKLTVTDENTCVGDTLVQVFIGPEFSFYIPDAFTPNGDGLNDVWRPIGSGINTSKYEVVIFDRWGKLVYKSNDFEEGWDGTKQNTGEKVAAGIYTYKIRVGDDFNEREEHTFRGNITIYTGEKKE